MDESKRQKIASTPRTELETWARSQAKAIPMGQDLLCRVLGDTMMYVDPCDRGISPHLAMLGYWEIWITQAIARHVKPGMVCLDVGMNAGYFTMLLADLVGESGLVHAFEPQENYCRLVQFSAEANGYQRRIKIWKSALGDAEGTVGMVIDRARSMNAHIAEGGTDAVPQIPLDSLTFGRLDFIKIDAEGSEPRIWAGMRQTLERHKPVVLIEYCPIHYRKQNVGWMEEATRGYRVRTVEGDGSLRDVTMREVDGSSDDSVWMLWVDR